VRRTVTTWVTRAALAVAGFAIALLVVEAALALRPARHCGGTPPFWRPDRDVGWALVPGVRRDAAVCRGTETIARHVVEVNALGQRDRPRTYARTPGRRRVLVLGDEERLGVEMLNAGVSGYSTDNELRAFVTRGARYAPDAVLLLVHVGNDVEENGPRLYLGNARGLPPNVPGVPELLGVYGAPETPAWQEAWETTEGTLRDLVGRVRATGARVGVVLGPAGIEVDPRIRALHAALMPDVQARRWDYDYPYRRLGDLLASDGVPWMSLVPALRAHRERTGRSGYYEWDAHWDAEGHAVVADALAPFVETLVRD
jgi:hypothetical protein